MQDLALGIGTRTTRPVPPRRGEGRDAPAADVGDERGVPAPVIAAGAGDGDAILGGVGQAQAVVVGLDAPVGGPARARVAELRPEVLVDLAGEGLVELEANLAADPVGDAGPHGHVALVGGVDERRGLDPGPLAGGAPRPVHLIEQDGDQALFGNAVRLLRPGPGVRLDDPAPARPERRSPFPGDAPAAPHGERAPLGQQRLEAALGDGRLEVVAAAAGAGLRRVRAVGGQVVVEDHRHQAAEDPADRGHRLDVRRPETVGHQAADVLRRLHEEHVRAGPARRQRRGHPPGGAADHRHVAANGLHRSVTSVSDFGQ